MVKHLMQISPVRYQETAGYWIIDRNGSIKEGEITEGTVSQKVLTGAFMIDPKNLKSFNVYFLQVQLQSYGLFKQRISVAKVYVLGPLQRDPQVETRLLPRFQEALVAQLNSELIERSGGIDAIIQSLQWEETTPVQV